MSETLKVPGNKQMDKAEATPEKAPPPRDIRIMPERVSLAEIARQDWVITAAAGTLIEDVMKPEYWSHIAPRLKPGDHIEVRVDTEEWLLELLVLETARSFTRVHLLKHHELGDWRDVEMKTAQHKIDWKGTFLKWSVIRLSDSAVIRDKFPTPEAASFFMIQHEKGAGK